jgi:ribosomal protein S18 acetylase RimI-like enzyme
MAWQLRPFALDDYPAVLALWQAAGPGLEVRPSDAQPEVAKKLARDPDLFLVAQAEGVVVGVIMGAWDGRRGWLHHLAVAQDYRDRGVASALVSEVEQRLRAKGCLKVNLLVQASNLAARRLYERLGYAEMPAMIALGKELSS